MYWKQSKKQEIEKVLSDDKLFNRALLSAFAELLSEMKKAVASTRRPIEHYINVV